MGWIRFLVQLQKDLRLWLVLVTTLGLFRIAILIALMSHWEPDTRFATLVTACARGLRFDIQLVTLWCLASILVSIACAWRDWSRWGDGLRTGLAIAFALITAALTACDIGYFLEYHDQFNHFLLGTVYDDQGAILSTVWNEYHPLRYLFGGLVAACGVGWAARRAGQRPFLSAQRLALWPWPILARGAFVLLFAGLLVGAVRGSFQRRPLQNKDAAVASDRLFDVWIPTPFHALGRALGDWYEMQNTSGITAFIPDGDLKTAAAAAFPDLGHRETVDDYLRQTATGPVSGSGKIPRQIFLVVVESLDAWPLMERYQSLHLTDGLRDLGRDGILISDFLPIGVGTMSSFAAIVTGLPDAGVYTAFRPSARQPFPSSPAAIFKKLGYRTRFFYSGYLSWQRIGDFCRDQGFDELYGGGHIGNPAGNEWGAEDEALFQFVERQVEDDQPSFNVILTTSNHPPYNVDVDAKGFPLPEIPASSGFDTAGGFTRRILGHLWYADRSVSHFVRAIEAKLPSTVVAVTGDHWSRRTFDVRPTCYERSAVPLLLHGPQILAGIPRPERLVGGHLDITSTLIELCAPRGFIYHSLGDNLLNPRRRLGLGYGRMMSPAGLWELSGDTGRLHPTLTSSPDQPFDRVAAQAWYQTCYGLGWWRLMRGNALVTTSH